MTEQNESTGSRRSGGHEGCFVAASGESAVPFRCALRVRGNGELSKGSARTTFVIGPALTLPGASYLAGLHQLHKPKYSTTATVLIVIGFNLGKPRPGDSDAQSPGTNAPASGTHTSRAP